ncbi:hypothetical protein MF271_01675 (plasmid) [Deinococcus sp. KNUC1210]|uniref:hypothetical protein n=1 Tax=Deinococcus sp. KNUC1210 TaxID=2917691 RepID=UPI001EF0C5E1|nr:hypothetical protein [Deinococcus sp. KNUC1210]ULH14256.1 hypothetical protein MF271_01675 [Deinococcus sp. KNUC1210]
MKDEIYIVAQAFPPVGGSHVARIIAFQKILSQYYNVTGISIKVGNKYPVIDNSSALNIDIIRTYPGFFHSIVHGKELQQPAELPIPHKMADSKISRLTSLKKLILTSIIKIYRKIEIIDSYYDWIPFLYDAIRKNVPKDAMLVSSSMPNSVHVATLLAILKRKNFWWADFGDPWTLNKSLPRTGIRKAVESYLEQQIVKRADLITFTTVETLKDYAEKYKLYAGKMHLLRMGYNENDNKFPLIDMPNPSVFYGGSLPSENRDSSEFVQAILRMQDVNFIFAGGSVNSIKKQLNNKIPNNVTLISWLDHGDFISYLKSSDISVIFGNSNYQQVPGKIYHYAAFARHILYISNIDMNTDETFSIIDQISEPSLNDRMSIEVKIRKLLSEERHILEMPTNLSWESALKPILKIINEKRS